MTLSRRSFVEKIGIAAAAGAASAVLSPFSAEAAPPELPQPEQQAIAKIAREFTERFGVPGMAVAIAAHGKVVLDQGFGVADRTANEPVTPRHRFRIASVSKPFTSAAIFSLVEQGRLRLEDSVFGEKGRLGFDFGKDVPDAVKEITVAHLLTHTCGGWSNKKDDPMFLNPAMKHAELIEWTCTNQPLINKPGAAYAYSNFGYCILGRLIEKLTGLPYGQAVQREVLAKCGITTMRIAGSTLVERAPNEVAYHTGGGGNPYGMNVARMDSHGGWIATAGDLVQFAMRVDGFPNPPDILRADTLKTMTTPSAASAGYACGWAVNKVPNWWHAGSLPGTTSTMVRTASGLCWAALTNVRAEGIGGGLDETMWKIAKAVPEWRA